MKNRDKEVKIKPLERICGFVDSCSYQDFGSDSICQEDYENCLIYQKRIEVILNKYIPK